MRIGVFVGASTADLLSLDELIGRIKRAEADGFDSFWVPHISARGYDALTVLALAGTQTSRIELGVGVVPTYPRHPVALAQQALTTAAAASNERFLLGIGPSHRPGIEDSFGLSYDRPALHVREYLSVLRPLMENGRVQFSGEFYNVNAELDVPNRPHCPVLISALAPRMLQLAGERADGTITWMAGPRTIPGPHWAANPRRRRCAGQGCAQDLRRSPYNGMRRRVGRAASRGRGLRSLRPIGELPARPGH